MTHQRKCAYCGNQPSCLDGTKLTKEHIFPNYLIKLFSECNYTFRGDKAFLDNTGPTIRDVCSKCNNGQLAVLDAYGNQLIEKYFFHPIPFSDKDRALHIDIKTDLLCKWILKILYNRQRAEKGDIKWFKNAIDYIMDDRPFCTGLFSVFMGLHVHVLPYQEDFFGMFPLNFYVNPLLLYRSRYEIRVSLNREMW